MNRTILPNPTPVLPAVCCECGNDEPADGYPYCLDCLEAGFHVEHFDGDCG